MSEAAENIIRRARSRTGGRPGVDPSTWSLPEPVDWEVIAAEPPHRDLALGLWCPRGRATVIYSPAKQGKSEFVLHQIHEALAEGAVVTYLDREMDHEDLRERMTDLGATPSEWARLRYYLYPTLPRFDEPGAGEVIVELCRRDGSNVAVFDTARRFVAGDENENDTWQRFWEYTGSVLKREGITWVRIDHSGKDKSKGTRGASSKNDDVDVVWELSRIDGGTRLRLTHARVGWLPQQIDYVRDEDPVRYRQAHFGLPEGTLTVAALLDRLGVPPVVSVKVAGTALRTAGHSATNSVLAAAVAHRKHAATNLATETESDSGNSGVPTLLGTALLDVSRNGQRNEVGTEDVSPGQEVGTGGGTPRNALISPLGTFPLYKSGTFPDQPRITEPELATRISQPCPVRKRLIRRQLLNP